ncbi:MAG: ankyrin repeat domain-containing protein [Sedimentisphaerales bacterium]|nr:ankyrin repeat domain-containing protein [Sedimentisphaerales bacterium]
MKRFQCLIIISLLVVLSSPDLSFAQRETRTQNIHQAIINGDTELVKSLLSGGMDVNEKNRMGWTPLHTALSKGKTEIAELLISKNADLNAKDNQGKTPLYLAIETDQKKFVDLLLAKNVDVNAVTRGGQNALTLARSKGDTALTELLVKHGAEEPVIDMEGDMLYGRRGGGPQGSGERGQGMPNQPMLPAQPTNQPSVLDDPNEVKARVKTFAGLEKAIKQVSDNADKEERQWCQKKYDNRTLLSRAVQTQFDSEMAFIKKIAEAEKAKKTIAAIDTLVSQKQERSKKVYRELLQLRRELEQSQSVRGRGRASGMGGRGSSSMRGGQMGMGNDMGDYYGEGEMMGRSSRSTRSTRPEEQVDAQTEAEIRLWSQAATDKKDELLKKVHEQVMLEMNSIRYVADEEKAKKTTATIDGLMLARLERYDQTILKMEEDARKEEERQQRLEQRLGRSSGRNMQGDPTQQNTYQRGRSRRR